MSIKRFHAATMTQGLKLVAAELGNDAVILSNRRVDGGVEILAALENQTEQFEAPEIDQPAPAVEQPDADRSALSSWLETLKVKRAAQEPDVGNQQQASAPVEDIQRDVAAQQNPQPQPTQVIEPSLQQVKDELEALKAMLQGQQLSKPTAPESSAMEVSRPQASLSRQAMAPEVVAELQGLGFSERFVNKMTPASNASTALNQIAAIMTPGRLASFNQGCILFTGATGAGKTTTLAKIATQQVISQGAQHVAIISADHFRIGAQESLRTIAKILGVQFASATPEKPLKAWLRHFSKKKLILIDTSGCRDGMRFIREQIADVQQPIKQLLTVPASHQPTVLSHQYQQSSKLIGNADGVVVTKLDENPVVGGIVEWLVQQRLMIHGWADGSNIPDDLHWSKTNEMLLKAKKKLDRRNAHRAA